MTVDAEKDALNARLTAALDRNSSSDAEAHPISIEQRDELNSLITVTEEKIENDIAGRKYRAFLGRLSALSRERNKHKKKK